MNHTNHVTGYQFKGDKAKPLAAAMRAHNFGSALWATPTQAQKVGLAPVPGAQPVQVLLNEKPFDFFNLDQLKPAGTTIQAAPKPTPTPKTAANRPTLALFKAAMPNGGKGMGAECAAFYAGLPNGGTYTAHMGWRSGEFIDAAMRFLADNGDAEGRRYTLAVEQVGWAVYTAFSPKGKPMPRPQLAGTYPMGSESTKLDSYQRAGMAHPTLRLTLKPTN